MKYFVLLSFFFLTITSQSQNWQLIWADEFNGTSLNTNNWTQDRGTGAVQGLNGWGNNELQYYQEQNTTVAGGVLTIEARQEPQGISDIYSGNNPYFYSSSKILTRDKFEFRYGKVEARIKTIDGQGYWPAFWMLPNGGCWPENGEIDIMEQWGHDGNSNATTGAAHTGVCGGGSTYSVGSSNLNLGSYADDYHLYSVIWSENNIAWYVDDQLFHAVTPSSYPSNINWPFNSSDWFIILNLAITNAGPNGNTVFPSQIDVDYVRVYQDPIGIYDISFNVDVTDLGLSATDIVYLNGNFNAWCGTCAPMQNQGNGLWSITVPLTAGAYEYKFTVNGWALSETLTGGESCTLTTGEFVNRLVQVADEAILPTVCWEECTGCNDFSEVTFQVDMNEYPNPFTNVNLSGGFNGWCGECNPMTDPDGNGVYSTTISLPFGAHEYKFSLDNWADAESFTPGEPCTNTTDIFTNRIINLSTDEVLPQVCWNSCSSCPSPVCQVPSNLDIVEIGFGGTNPRVNATWNNAEGTSSCEVKGGRISDASAGTTTPIFQNMSNTQILSQTNGSTVNFNIVLYNNPTIPFVIGKTYGYEVRCQCADGSGFSDWSGISPSSTFMVPASGSAALLGTKAFENEDIQLNVYPNPSNGIFHMDLVTEYQEEITLMLNDLLGKTLLSMQLKGGEIHKELDFRHLQKGVYVLILNSQSGMFTERIIIQ
jgi:beta-glucanase (GH16 family)